MQKNNIIISPSTKNIVLPIQLTIQSNNKKATLLFKKRKCKANTFGTPISKKKSNIFYCAWLSRLITLFYQNMRNLEHSRGSQQNMETASSSVQFNLIQGFLFNSLHAAPNHNKSLLNVTISKLQVFVLKSRTSDTAV